MIPTAKYAKLAEENAKLRENYEHVLIALRLLTELMEEDLEDEKSSDKLV